MRTPADTGHLDSCLRQACQEEFGTVVSLSDAVRETVAGGVRYPWEKWTVPLADGRKTAFFYKDLAYATGERGPRKSTRNATTEIRMYREILDRERYGTAQHHASGLDPDRLEYWLLLEWVHGSPPDSDDMSALQDIAGWLARFHAGWLGSSLLETADFLPRYSASYFLARIENAQAVVAQLDPVLSHQLEVSWDRLGIIFAELDDYRPTLIHGEFRRRHVFYSRNRRSPRVCPIDWERAGVGPALYDLSYLSTPLQADVREAVVHAYRLAAQEEGIPRVKRETMDRHLKAIELATGVEWLGKTRQKKYATDRVARMIERLWRLIHDLEVAPTGGAR